MLICDKCRKEISPYRENFMEVAFLHSDEERGIITKYCEQFHTHCYTKVMIFVYPNERSNHCTCNHFVRYRVGGLYVSARLKKRNTAIKTRYHHLDCFRNYYMLPIRDELLC